MSIVHADLVKETTTTTGTGTYSLAGAASGFRTFVAGVGTGNQCAYAVKMSTDWEIVLGTVTDATPDTLTRDYLIASSSGAFINWGAGTKDIYAVNPAKVAPGIMHLGTLRLPGSQASSGTIIAPVSCSYIFGSAYVIAPGAVVPRLLVGGTAIDNGTNYAGANNRPNVNPVAQVSLNGWGLVSAAMASTNETLITFAVRKAATGKIARATWQSSNISIVASTAPFIEDGAGIWVNTTALVQQIELRGYSAVTGTVAANMSAGSELQVYGSVELPV